MPLTRRDSYLRRLVVAVALLAGIAGAAGAQTMTDRMKELERYYADFKKPQPLGGTNPHKRTVTICAGFPFKIEDTQRGTAELDRGKPAGDSEISARSAGSNGSIEILSATKGSALLKYKVGDQAKEVYVLVVDCSGAAMGQLPRSPRTITPRRARCAACAEEARKLNAAADRYNQAQRANAPAAQLDQIYAEVMALSKALDECETKCARTSMGPKVYIGGAAAAGTALAFAAGGGSPTNTPAPAPIGNVNPSPAPAPTPTPGAPAPAPGPPAPAPQPGTPAPAPTQPDPSGPYIVQLTITSDVGRHDQHTLYSSVTRLDVQVDGTLIRITGPFPWVTVTGTFTPSTGAFTANGTGTVAGFSNVPVSMTGMFSGNSLAIGQVQVGPTNLPGDVAELLSGSGAKQ